MQQCPGHFLENGAVYADNNNTPYVVLPAPYERTVSYGAGTGNAPAAILAASAQLELFDEEFCRPLDLQVQTLPAPDCRGGDEKKALECLRHAAEPVLSAGRFLLTLGGEHAVSAPLIAAAARVHPGLSVLHLDAHLDLRDSYEGNPLSHASVMRRVIEMGVPVVHVGIRSVCAEEYNLVKERLLPVFWMRDIDRCAGNDQMDGIVKCLTECVYISLDVDVLDTGIMPGTGTPEPGGMSWSLITRLLRQVFRERNVVAADLVETMPIPGMVVAEYTAARLAGKLLVYHKFRKCQGEGDT